MRCPVHVAVEMELAVADRPHFAMAGGDEEEKRASRQRRYWRCTVPGCRQVSQIVGDAIEPKKAAACSRCGAPGDPEIHAMVGILSCRNCYRSNAREKNRALRERSLKRGAAIGSAASASARAYRRGQAPSSHKGLAENRAGASAKGGAAGRGIARIRIRNVA